MAEALRSYLDTFDQRVTGRTGEISSTLDERLAHFETVLGSRVSDIAKALTEGGKDVVEALDQRIGEVAGTINSRGVEVADSISAKIGEIDKTLGRAPLRSPTILTAVSAASRNSLSAALRPSQARSRPAPKPLRMHLMRGWNN